MNQTSCEPVTPPVAGQLAVVIVQVSPAVVSVQAASAELPSDCEIFAPEIAVAPAASLVTFSVALPKSALARPASEAS